MTLTPLHVLFVEHNRTDVELCVAELQRASFDVHVDVAETPEQFAALLNLNPYDVVLADYRLPGWTGMDAFAVLKARSVDIPFILITGTLGEERAVDCVKEGVADYVLKLNLARLPLAVRRAMDERIGRSARAKDEDQIRKLSLAVDQGSASVIITDLDARIEYVNRRFTEVTGYAPEEALGKTPRLWQSGRTPIAVYHALWQAIRGGTIWRGEILNRRKDGRLFWDAVTISPIRGPDGAITHYLATQEDITVQKAAAAILVEREERFRQIAENINDVFFVWEADFSRILYVSPAYERIWGRTCQSLYENPDSFLASLSLEDQSRVQVHLARIREGSGGEAIEFQVLRPDGAVRWVLSRVVPIRDEEEHVYRISGIVMDITERKQVAAAQEESALRFRKIIDASFDGIEISENGIIREVNTGFVAMFGYADASEIIGRHTTAFAGDESLEDVAGRGFGRDHGSRLRGISPVSQQIRRVRCRRRPGVPA
ncbi:MAG: PAS domain S-box protein, partial [Gemmatimonadota bacterium]